MIPSMMGDVDVSNFIDGLRDDIDRCFDDIMDNVKEDMEFDEEQYWYTSTIIRYMKDRFSKKIKSAVSSMEAGYHG
jgi:hypothetical protein